MIEYVVDQCINVFIDRDSWSLTATTKETWRMVIQELNLQRCVNSYVNMLQIAITSTTMKRT